MILESVLTWVQERYTRPQLSSAAIMLILGATYLDGTEFVLPFCRHFMYRKSVSEKWLSSMLMIRSFGLFSSSRYFIANCYHKTRLLIEFCYTEIFNMRRYLIPKSCFITLVIREGLIYYFSSSSTTFLTCNILEIGTLRLFISSISSRTFVLNSASYFIFKTINLNCEGYL